MTVSMEHRWEMHIPAQRNATQFLYVNMSGVHAHKFTFRCRKDRVHASFCVNSEAGSDLQRSAAHIKEKIVER